MFQDTINNLNEMNRKLYEENQQFKERNLEQRQQIEHYHLLFQEAQQKAEQTVGLAIRKEREEAMQRESELKRRLQQSFDNKQQDNFIIINNLKEKIDEFKTNESRLCEQLNGVKMELQQERNKVELLEKRLKMAEKDSQSAGESWLVEKAELEAKINELKCQLEHLRKQSQIEKQKLEEKNFKEREEFKSQVKQLESKFEEMIKEKAQNANEYGQLVENNRELNNIIKNKDSLYEKTSKELQ